MITTYKFKMKPSASQKKYFSMCFGCARFVYNHALKEKTGAYSSGKKSLSFFDLCANIREPRRPPGPGINKPIVHPPPLPRKIHYHAMFHNLTVKTFGHVRSSSYHGRRTLTCDNYPFRSFDAAYLRQDRECRILLVQHPEWHILADTEGRDEGGMRYRSVSLGRPAEGPRKEAVMASLTLTTERFTDDMS